MATGNSSPMLRGALGIFLLLHGLGHSISAMHTADTAAGWLDPAERTPALFILALLLWASSAGGFMAAGLALLGSRTLRPHWSALAFAAALCSIVLLLLALPAYAIVGIIIDSAILLTVRLAGARWIQPSGKPFRWYARVGNALALLLVAYAVLVILARPLIMSDGARTAEIGMAMPGDHRFAGAATYAVHHAVTIDAPPAAVWPWLTQIGQDKGGFYSHAFLENLAGCRLRNADHLNPAWQRIAAGDTIWATPPNYLGTGRRFGWRIDHVEPERVLVLRNWGQFILLPQNDGSTRLLVRTRVSRPPRLQDVMLAPFGVLLFEPAHFIMEREMLRGIKARAERSS